MAFSGTTTYGSSTASSFVLNGPATLATDATTNKIQAATSIFLYGDVDIAKGGTLALEASNPVRLYGTMTTGLGMDSYGSMAVTNNLTFYEDSVLSLYWDDNLASLYDGWSKEYNIFDVGGSIRDDGLILDMSAFDAYEGFSYVWNSNIGVLSLSYSSEVPEPATLAILGLGLAGLGLAKRRVRR